MKLTPQQLEQFDRDGYLFFPSLFTPAEITPLLDEVPRLYAQQRPENVMEKSGVVRTNFAAHMYSKPFATLARHPRMLTPVMQMYGEKLYMHQFKINGKMAFDGDVWQWHQDYGTWVNDDHMPEPRAMNVAIFLDEVNEFNGPPGSMIMFHSCLVHSSTSNLSPWNRVAVYLSVCAVSNHIRRFKRPEYIAHRDFTPLECLPDDCLLKDYDVPLPWKDGTPAAALKSALAV